MKAEWSRAENGVISLWKDAESPDPDYKIPITEEIVYGMTFTHDGSRLIVAERYNIQVFDVESREELGDPMDTFFHSARSMATNQDDTILAIGAIDGNVVLYDLVAQEVLGQPLVAHEDIVDAVDFSPDGKTMASKACGAKNDQGWCTDSGIILWDVEKQQYFSTPILIPNPRIDRVVFGPNGQQLAAVGSDGRVLQMLDFNIETLLEAACRMANRNLTEAEWALYFPNEGYRATCDMLPLHG